MLLFCGVLLFLPLIIPGLTARDNLDDFSFGGASFLPLIIPPPGGGGIVNAAFLRGVSFLRLIISGLSARDSIA